MSFSMLYTKRLPRINRRPGLREAKESNECINYFYKRNTHKINITPQRERDPTI